MPKKRKRFFDNIQSDDEDKFETEAFSHMNEAREENKHKHFGDSDSDVELTDSDDNEPTSEDRLLYQKDDRTAIGDNGDGDDEAPESVGFQDSRLSALTQFRSAMKQIESEKQKKKGLRKKIDEQYKEQKAKKLSDLSASRLPDEFLDSLEETIPSKKAKVEKVKTKVVGKKKNKTAADTEAETLDDLGPDDSVTAHPVAGNKEDFISLTDSASGVEVMDVRRVDRATKTMAQKAAEFRQNRLYGSDIQRESNKQRLAKKEKRRQRFR